MAHVGVKSPECGGTQVYRHGTSANGEQRYICLASGCRTPYIPIGIPLRGGETRNGQILAYAFGRRKDEVFRNFKKLLSPFGISIYYTDDCGSYERNLPSSSHVISKKNTQAIERKNLTLRTRIKRLRRKTIRYSKSVFMHDTVIGLAVNIMEFRLIIDDFYRCRT